MKKAEMLEIIQKVYDKVTEAQDRVDDLRGDLRKMHGLLEELPNEVDEIEEEEKPSES